MFMHTYVHTSVCSCLCVCWRCMCGFISVKPPGGSWGFRADSEWGEQHPLSRSPCPLVFPLAEPQFEPQCVHSVQVVSEQPFVSDKTQVLVQLQGRLVGDFGLQYDLRRHTTAWACFYMDWLYRTSSHHRSWFKGCAGRLEAASAEVYGAWHHTSCSTQQAQQASALHAGGVWQFLLLWKKSLQWGRLCRYRNTRTVKNLTHLKNNRKYCFLRPIFTFM